MIGIIDYGMGNLKSVTNALEHLNIPCKLCTMPSHIKACDKLILPGVGAFKEGMQNIEETGFQQAIRDAVKQGVPLLGICLGMQMLLESSEEKGHHIGFGFIQGKVKKIEENLPVPQIGWNALQFQATSPIKQILSPQPYMYYVHSYYASVEKEEQLVAYSMYGNTKVAGIIQNKNVLGTQFHPEKSGEEGLRLLKYFAEEFQ